MIGIGYDIHRLEKNETLVLGGINIPSDLGTVAHSDGDVLIHAIIDAILGASGLGDIGEHFPDTDIQFKNANSYELLIFVNNLLQKKNLHIINIDATIVLEKPKLSLYKNQIRSNLAKLLDLKLEQISIKATTNEKLDSIGHRESIAVFAVCQCETNNNTNAL